jgi:hypothetical protein
LPGFVAGWTSSATSTASAAAFSSHNWTATHRDSKQIYLYTTP